MYRKDAVIKAGGYSLHAHNFEDYFLWMQLKKYGKFYNLPQQLLKFVSILHQQRLMKNGEAVFSGK